MDAISKTKAQIEYTPHGLVTKHTDHPFAAALLGEVIGVHWLQSGPIFYYRDGHKVKFSVDDEGELVMEDYEVPSC